MQKKLLYTICALLALVCSASRSQAQYNIASHAETTAADTMCFGPRFTVTTNMYAATLTIKTYFGDGSSQTNTVVNSGGIGTVSLWHSYTTAGTFTVKHVLYNGTTAIDSVMLSYEYLYCNFVSLKAYYDVNGNCTQDPSEPAMTVPMKWQVDSAGTVVDTIEVVSGSYYYVRGLPGTVYTFTMLPSTGYTVTCPATGVVTDTIHPMFYMHSEKIIGMSCSSATAFDLAINASGRAAASRAVYNLLVTNSYCTPQAATVTMHFSPKYQYDIAYPAPATVSGTTLTWTFPAVSAFAPEHISVHLLPSAAWLTLGDTVHSDFAVAPTSGDADPSNNSIVRVDTVIASFDPNEKEVSPRGDITAGTKLTYTIHFENMGSDTAYNVHVLDTLSGNLVLSSFKMMSSSAPATNISFIEDGGYNIIRFDFPNIKLQDSSKKGLNDGMFVFSMNTKTGLPSGTLINNRAGIYFDFNEVVLTNTVTNRIGFPAGVQAMSNAAAGIYPNPVSNELNINTGGEQYDNLTITNALGQLMMSRSLGGTTDKVNVKALPAGTYFISLKGASGIKTQQFQKL